MWCGIVIVGPLGGYLCLCLESATLVLVPLMCVFSVLRIVARAADAHRLNQAFSETPFDGFKFSPITEHQASSDPASPAL